MGAQVLAAGIRCSRHAAKSVRGRGAFHKGSSERRAGKPAHTGQSNSGDRKGRPCETGFATHLVSLHNVAACHTCDLFIKTLFQIYFR